MSKPWMPHVTRTRSRQEVSLQWHAAPALQSEGTILVADHERGLQVVAPPGVALPTSADDAPGEIHDERAWRWALWVTDVNGELWMERSQPVEVRTLSLQDVVELLPPSRFAWVHERCRRRMLAFVGYVTPSASGTVPPDAAVAWQQMEELLEELEEVFPDGEWRALVPYLPDRLEIPDALPEEPHRAQPPKTEPTLVRVEEPDAPAVS